MKTKIIPFDLETVEKIQAGEIEGKVYFKTKLADGSGTYIFNLKSIHSIDNLECPYYGLFEFDGEEYIQYIRANGYVPEQLVTLIIEVPDNESQFKPFDKVLVRENDGQVWYCDFYSYTDSIHGVHYCVGHCGEQIIPYEGNQELVGTCNEPKCK